MNAHVLVPDVGIRRALVSLSSLVDHAMLREALPTARLPQADSAAIDLGYLLSQNARSNIQERRDARSLTLAVELPAVIVSALRRLDEAFARDGNAGPATMVQSLCGAIPGLSLDDDLDLSIRDVVCASVRELLGPALGR